MIGNRMRDRWRTYMRESSVKFVKDVWVVGVTNIIIALSGIILLPILTKTLGASNYGIWVQAIVTINLITPLATLGLSGAMVRFLAAEKDIKEIQEGLFSTIVSVFLVGCVASFLLVIFSALLAKSFFGNAVDILKILAFIIPFWCVDVVFLDFFRAFRQIKRYSAFKIGVAYGEVGAVLFSVLSGFGLKGAVLSLLAVRIVFFLIMLYLILRQIGVKLPIFKNIKLYLNFGLPLVPSAIAQWAISLSDRYVIGFFLGVASVGFYSPGYAIGTLIVILFEPIVFVLLPTLYKLFDEQRIDETKKYLSLSLKYFLLFAIPAGAGLFILSKQVLTILSTTEIAENGYYITPFIAVATILWGVYEIFARVLDMFKKTKIIGAVRSVAAFINLILNIIFIPIFGIVGAAVTTLIAYTLTAVAAIYFSRKYLKFETDFVFIIKSVVASAVMVVVILGLNPHSIVEVLISIAAGGVVYMGVLLLLKGWSYEEIKFVLRLGSNERVR